MSDEPIGNLMFCIISVLAGCYLVIRNVYDKEHKANRLKIALGIILIAISITGIFVKIFAVIASLLFGCLMLVYMYRQEKRWKGHRFTTAYWMHFSGWCVCLGAIIYGFVLLF